MTAEMAVGIATGVIHLVWLQKRPVAESIIRIVLLRVLLALHRLGAANRDMESISTEIRMELVASDDYSVP